MALWLDFGFFGVVGVAFLSLSFWRPLRKFATALPNSPPILDTRPNSEEEQHNHKNDNQFNSTGQIHYCLPLLLQTKRHYSTKRIGITL